MAHASLVELVSNSNPKLASRKNHSCHINNLFTGATHLDCIVAFANTNGLNEIWEPLIEALKNGMRARFVIGLDFFHTEPDTLEWLLQLAEDDYPGQVQLFISAENRKRTLHPKAYVFQYRKTYGQGPCKAVVGSANMTKGGLCNNHEFSLYLEEKGAALAKTVDSEISRMLSDMEVDVATKELIEEYARQHKIYALHAKLAQKMAKASVSRTPTPAGGMYLNDLKAILALMKADAPNDEFSRQQVLRTTGRAFARTQLAAIRTNPVNTQEDFLNYYAPLVAQGWQSGNLKRRKATVAMNGPTFQAALQALETLLQAHPNASVATAYELLHSMLMDVAHVGPNIISEILHTYDNTRFAVLNKNSARGLAMADITGYVKNLNKVGVAAPRYAEFCTDMERVRVGLGLADFSELDAIFNFAYWR